MKVNASLKQENAFHTELATLGHNLNQIASVVNSAYKKVKYLQENTERISPTDLQEILSDPKKRIYLCLSPNREICGTVLVHQISEEKAEIGLFAIHPNFQGKKIGLYFLKQIENEAFKKAREIILKVILLYQEKLIAFYEKQGYSKTGEILPFPHEDKLRFIRPECRDQVFFSVFHKFKESKEL
jgi:GNAT superfamily N-acetyltransferase